MRDRRPGQSLLLPLALSTTQVQPGRRIAVFLSLLLSLPPPPQSLRFLHPDLMGNHEETEVMDQLPRHFLIRSSVQSIPILISRIVLPWNTVTSVTTSVTIALIGMLLDIYDRCSEILFIQICRGGSVRLGIPLTFFVNYDFTLIKI